MENITLTLQLIDKYGLSLVLLIIVSMIVYNIGKIIFESLYPRFLSIIDTSLSIQDKKRVTTTIGMKRDIIINQLLDDLLDTTQASRAYLFKFHNGGKSIDGLDYIRCSNTNEVVCSGCKPLITISQGLPIGMFWAWNRLFLEHKMVRFVKDDAGYMSYSIDRPNTVCTYAVGIYDFNRLLLGFIGVDYDHIVDDKYFHDAHFNHKLYSVADRLAAILVVHDDKSIMGEL